ncbi:uncharacterized protein MONBRDRAFT_38735 [Monosiga brevicollis MX1]|uniref:Uncharacterized protein n=1 Tax=Monosiga brevicollis TaxID=81824 RepID=A9V9T6_MONBE|nr:uncharacterized protein MONBRDRAFT_38735 [Monosiga brevicollis MX1]EDQ85781.1 predicted protein [Monosiga brevicollis MX1]|eukprot:XP_001749496.1 hypothetical protein [Monosiga brevicollis MX1]
MCMSPRLVRVKTFLTVIFFLPNRSAVYDFLLCPRTLIRHTFPVLVAPVSSPRPVIMSFLLFVSDTIANVLGPTIAQKLFGGPDRNPWEDFEKEPTTYNDLRTRLERVQKLCQEKTCTPCQKPWDVATFAVAFSRFRECQEKLEPFPLPADTVPELPIKLLPEELKAIDHFRHHYMTFFQNRMEQMNYGGYPGEEEYKTFLKFGFAIYQAASEWAVWRRDLEVKQGPVPIPEPFGHFFKMLRDQSKQAVSNYMVDIERYIYNPQRETLSNYDPQKNAFKAAPELAPWRQAPPTTPTAASGLSCPSQLPTPTPSN